MTCSAPLGKAYTIHSDAQGGAARHDTSAKRHLQAILVLILLFQILEVNILPNHVDLILIPGRRNFVAQVEEEIQCKCLKGLNFNRTVLGLGLVRIIQINAQNGSKMRGKVAILDIQAFSS